MKIGADRLSAFTRLFSSSVLKEMAATGRSPLFSRLVRQSFDEGTEFPTVRDAFDAAFNVLLGGEHRDEYVYKAALTHRVLLGKHSLRSACLLSEFRVGPCKADVVILNGTASVYEIKSERDGLGRLCRQMDAYSKVFPRRYVIAAERHVDAVLASTSAAVGVLQLSKRYQISTVREAEDSFELLDPSAILASIRVEEAAAILTRLRIEVPAVPNTRVRAEMQALFAGCDTNLLHSAFLSTLKMSRSLATLDELVSHVPSSLQAAVLTTPLRRGQYGNLLRALGTNFDEAVGWA